MGAGAVFGTFTGFWYPFPHIELICRVLIQKEVVLLQLDMPDFVAIKGGLHLPEQNKRRCKLGLLEGRWVGTRGKEGRGSVVEM